MTGGWAATNTIRASLVNVRATLRGLMSDPAVTRTTDLTREIEECSSALAALALVEAALDEADLSIHWFSALLSVIEKHDKPLAMGIVAQAGGGQIRLANLAAALRAVREGQ